MIMLSTGNTHQLRNQCILLWASDKRLTNKQEQVVLFTLVLLAMKELKYLVSFLSYASFFGRPTGGELIATLTILQLPLPILFS